MSRRAPHLVLIELGGLLAASWLCVHHHSGGLKGSWVPIETVALCVALSALAAVVIGLAWRRSVAPFVAGIIGALGAGPMGSPYGGLLGLSIGVAVAAALPGPERPSSSMPLANGIRFRE